MAEYLIQSETLISIADEVRELNGITGTMGLNVMKTNLCNANDEVNTQTELIAQIVNTIEGKAAEGAQATPIIMVNKSNGLITATAGSKSSTYQLAFQPAKTITPSTTSQIAVSRGYYTGGSVTVAAIPSTYIQPSGTKTISVNGTYDIKNYASVSVNVISEEMALEDDFVKRTLTTYANDRVTYVGSYAFANCSKLYSIDFPNVKTINWYAFYNCRNLVSANFPAATTIGNSAFGIGYSLASVSFPVATSIGYNAFYNCSSLTSVSFPAVTTIDNSAFYACRNLVSANFPVATTIGNEAFYLCSNLASISFPAVTSIGYDAFYHCYNLASANFPAVTTISNSAFYYCENLVSANFPAVTTIGNSAFYACRNLVSANFPAATTIGNSAFRNCSNLASISFPAVTSIGYDAFYNCTMLSTIHLGASSLCTLAGTKVFYNTGIASNKGSIYVPASLVASYKSATNWTYLSARIFSAP